MESPNLLERECFTDIDSYIGHDRMKNRMASPENYTRSEGIWGKRVKSEPALDSKTRMII